MELVKRNLPKAHKDGGTIRILKREFEKEYLVLVLLPMSSSKLLAQWLGPYQIEKKVERVNYHC